MSCFALPWVLFDHYSLFHAFFFFKKNSQITSPDMFPKNSMMAKAAILACAAALIAVVAGDVYLKESFEGETLQCMVA